MNIQEMIQRFNQFKNTYSGNPQQHIQQMLNSGRVSQAQYNQAVQIARQLQQIIGKL